MFLRYSIITAIFAACFGSIQAQSVDSLFSGTWIGELTQNPGGMAQEYPFRVVIKVSGNKVTGVTYSNIYDDPNFAIMEFSGTIFKGKLLTFQETKIIDATAMTDYIWCMKGGQLTLTQRHDKLVLEGYWQGTTKMGTSCIPGKIYLVKNLMP